MRPVAGPLAAAALLLAAGCAYYNGMYNTKRLAGLARKAEREGRTFDATNYWGQVAVKAESVAAKHPGASWADEARYLHGTALVKLNDCPNGLKVLDPLLTTARDAEIREGSAFLVGGCRMRLGDAEGATEAFARLLHSRDPERHALALYADGHALRLAGRLEEALTELGASTEPRARGERDVVLAGLGRLDQALPLADSLLTHGDTTVPWRDLVTATAAHDSAAGDQLVDRIARSALPAPLRTRVLLDEGIRLMPTDTARGERRLAQADSIGRGTRAWTEVRQAQARLLVEGVSSVPELRKAVMDLQDLGEGGGGDVSIGGAQAALGQRVLEVLDSTGAGTPEGDLRLFLAGEMIRDSLGADRLAALEFRRVAAEWRQSPYAAKAILALIDLDPAAADSLREVLGSQYPDNPYVALAQGEDSPAYAVLEDSLQRAALSLRFQPRRPFVPQGRPARPNGAQPAMPRQPVDQ